MKVNSRQYIPPVQYIWRIVRVGSSLVVIEQWEYWRLKPEALGSIPGDYWLFLC